MAIQQKVIGTRNYQKDILRHDVDDKCRLCENPNEAIEHIIDDCRIMAQREYTRRHNDVCGIIQQQIALNLGLLQDWKPYYRYVLVPVLDSEHYLLYWGRAIQIDHLVVHKRSGIFTEMWRVKTTIVHPNVISDTGNVHVRCVSQLRDLGVVRVLAAVQKAVLLNTCRIVRSFLDHQEESGQPLLDPP